MWLSCDNHGYSMTFIPKEVMQTNEPLILGFSQGSDSQINPNFPGQTTEFKEGQCREPKRLKLTREDLSKTCGIEKPTNFVSAFYSESDDQVVISAMPCAFCQSSKESEVNMQQRKKILRFKIF